MDQNQGVEKYKIHWVAVSIVLIVAVFLIAAVIYGELKHNSMKQDRLLSVLVLMIAIFLFRVLLYSVICDSDRVVIKIWKKNKCIIEYENIQSITLMGFPFFLMTLSYFKGLRSTHVFLFPLDRNDKFLRNVKGKNPMVQINKI